MTRDEIMEQLVAHGYKGEAWASVAFDYHDMSPDDIMGDLVDQLDDAATYSGAVVALGYAIYDELRKPD